MIAETGKTLIEADQEISEAIDFLNYYPVSLSKFFRASTQIEAYTRLHKQQIPSHEQLQSYLMAPLQMEGGFGYH